MANLRFHHKSYRMQERGEYILPINNDIDRVAKCSVCCFCKMV